MSDVESHLNPHTAKMIVGISCLGQDVNKERRDSPTDHVVFARPSKTYVSINHLPVNVAVNATILLMVAHNGWL